LEVNGSGNTITGNKIYSTGGGGILSRSFDKEPNVYACNHIHHCGEVYHSATGINIDDGGGVIKNNLIHDISHSGVYARHWATKTQPLGRANQEQALIIENNEIYKAAKWMNDAGGIFVRDSNMFIRNNLIHDILSYGEACPGWGIYLGCETNNTSVENNVIYRCREFLHFLWKNRNVTIQNNIFVYGGIGTWKNPPVRHTLNLIDYNNIRRKELAHKNIRFIRNIIYYANDSAYLYFVDREVSLPQESDYNVLYCTGKSIHDYPVIMVCKSK